MPSLTQFISLMGQYKMVHSQPRMMRSAPTTDRGGGGGTNGHSHSFMHRTRSVNRRRVILWAPVVVTGDKAASITQGSDPWERGTARCLQAASTARHLLAASTARCLKAARTARQLLAATASTARHMVVVSRTARRRHASSQLPQAGQYGMNPTGMGGYGGTIGGYPRYQESEHDKHKHKEKGKKKKK